MKTKYHNTILRLIDEYIEENRSQLEIDNNEMVFKLDLNIQKIVDDENGSLEYYVEGVYEQDIISVMACTDEPHEHILSDKGRCITEVFITNKDAEEVYCDTFNETLKSYFNG